MFAAWLPAQAAGLWIAANILLLLGCSAWGVLHPRALLAAGVVPLRWAFWIALLTALWLYARMPEWVPAQAPVFLSSALQFASATGVFVGVLIAASFLGYAFAALGAAAARPYHAGGSNTGVWIGFGFLVVLGAIEGVLGEAAPGLLHAALLCGPPLPAFLLVRLAARSGWSYRPLQARLVYILSRRLVWEAGRAGRRLRLDFRGAFLGALGAAAALLIGAAGLLLPLESGALTGMLQIRNEPLVSRELPFSLGSLQQGAARGAERRIVLLRMDDGTRRSALTERSEADVQADVIAKLRAFGAHAVVLPVPALSEKWLPPFVGAPDSPTPDSKSIARTLRDLPRLAESMRRAGNVLLTVPEIGAVARSPAPDASQDGFRGLVRAAWAAGREGLGGFGWGRLPTLSVQPERAALLPGGGRLYPAANLAAEAAGHHAPVSGTLSGRMASSGAAVEIEAGEVLVNFLAAEPGRDFARVSYEAVLGGERIYQRPLPDVHDLESGPRGQRRPRVILGRDRRPGTVDEREQAPGKWVEPASYFSGRLVFLDSLLPRALRTPIGIMDRIEVQANAAATLLDGRFVRPLPRVWELLLVLLCGVMSGVGASRRTPFRAAMVAAAIAFALFLGCTGLFVLGSYWADPVPATLAAALAAALATQVTYLSQRDERDRNRAVLERFLPPQVVEGMLEDPEGKLSLGGKRQQVCVLFADVRDFTGFAEAHSPEEVVAVTNRYLRAMTEALFVHGGILDKYTGDGLMAFFPVTDPARDVDRAVHAAVALRDAAMSVTRSLAGEGRGGLRIGIGMHYGEAIVGLVGIESRPEYTAMGHTVVVSNRLQGLAKGGQVVISETAYMAMSGAIPAEAGEPVQVKGVTALVRPYLLLGPGEAPSAPG